ncbi:MAG: hypothetical protein INQ03_05135 [Candidatus Heimdallarchaeota archaeon]|nr:hypothetical protein [Candidatus Heimdallarchaeota archaeon]
MQLKSELIDAIKFEFKLLYPDLKIDPINGIYGRGKMINMKRNRLNLSNFISLGIKTYPLYTISLFPDIDLSHNQICTLSFLDFDRVDNIRMLNLSNNYLDSLPMEISKLKNLIRLNLSDNRFESIPIQIASLKKLSSLRMNNISEEIPDFILQHPKLTFLHLNNKLIRLDKIRKEIS